MKTAWSEDAWQDYLHRQQEEQKILTAINDLIKDIKRDPFKGFGKPEPLNMPCRAGGPAASQASTAWFIGCPARASISNSISPNAAIISDRSGRAHQRRVRHV
jgi:hypothetical protein